MNSRLKVQLEVYTEKGGHGPTFAVKKEKERSHSRIFSFE